MDIHCTTCLGYDPIVAPKIDNLPYDQWCSRFNIFIRSKQFDLWEVIEDAYIIPTSEKSKWSNNDKRMFNMNKLLLEYLLNAFDSSFSNKFVHFDSAYNLWKFKEAHQGNLEEIRRSLEDCSSGEFGASSCTRPLGGP